MCFALSVPYIYLIPRKNGFWQLQLKCFNCFSSVQIQYRSSFVQIFNMDHRFSYCLPSFLLSYILYCSPIKGWISVTTLWPAIYWKSRKFLTQTHTIKDIRVFEEVLSIAPFFCEINFHKLGPISQNSLKKIQIHKRKFIKSHTVNKFILSEKLHPPFNINSPFMVSPPFSKTNIPFSQPLPQTKMWANFQWYDAI